MHACARSNCGFDQIVLLLLIENYVWSELYLECLLFKSCILYFCLIGSDPLPERCSDVRQRALSNIAKGAMDVSVPECDEDGFYKLGFYCGWRKCYCIYDKYTGTGPDAQTPEDCA